ncbi:MAG: hypothetical protein Kow0092_18880 [Deferrisomatales bacterium]
MRRRSAAEGLRRVAAAYQRERVLPRCGACARPCCRLDTLVLELDWERLRRLWGVRGSRRAFDASLARGEGPPDIRAQEGLYYAHGRVCPAYREGRCAVYESALKPPGCTDFPVYEEDGALVADLRCEAVDPDEVEARLRRALGPRRDVRRRADPRFRFLVRFRVRPRRR